MCSRMQLMLLALAVAILPGCATIATGNSQTIAVRTEPENADCQFTRDNLLIARVNPTPGVMHVGKASGAISVLCRREGYQDTIGTLGSEFQPATFGNIILGGVIGVVVDAASGALSKYPASVTVTLLPIAFDSQAERDRFYEELRSTFLREYEEVVTRIKASCKHPDCESQLKAADQGRHARLADIERRRLATNTTGARQIDSPNPDRSSE